MADVSEYIYHSLAQCALPLATNGVFPNTVPATITAPVCRYRMVYGAHALNNTDGSLWRSRWQVDGLFSSYTGAITFLEAVSNYFKDRVELYVDLQVSNTGVDNSFTIWDSQIGGHRSIIDISVITDKP